MKRLDNKSKPYESHNRRSRDDFDDVRACQDLQSSHKRTELHDGAGFTNHFVVPVRKSGQQQDCGNAEPVQIINGDTVTDVTERSKSIPIDMKWSDEIDSLSSSPNSSSKFMSERIDFFSKNPANIKGGTQEHFKKSTRSELESNIIPVTFSYQPLIPRDNVEPTYRGHIPSKERCSESQPQRYHSHNDPNTNTVQGTKLSEVQPGNQYCSISSLHSQGFSSSKGKYNNSGKPNVYQSNQTNGKIPLLPLPVMTTFPRENDVFEFQQEQAAYESSKRIPMCPMPYMNAYPSDVPVVFPNEERPNTVPPCKFRTDLEPQRHLSTEAERTSMSNNPLYSNSSDTKPARSYLPFPIGKASPGKSGLPVNRFLDADAKPNQRPMGANAKPDLPRQAPLLNQFQDKLSLTRGFSSNKGGIQGSPSARENVVSPMENNYSLISNYVRKSESLTEARRMELTSSEAVMRVCGQRCPVPMEFIFTGLQSLEKVGEGVFGEVFSGVFIQNGNMRVYKIVAIEGGELVNGERQKTYAEILPEIIISQQLSKLHDGYKKCFTDGFIKLHNARITYGTYPTDLVTAWKSWDKLNNSDNDCPEFKNDQLYIVFEYDHGGDDVESFHFINARQTFYLTLQVAHILSVGECSMEMEHRDLHWGNILVEKTEYQNVSYHFNGKTRTIPSFGVKACIIDFTIARLVDEEKKPVFLDLKEDEEQFLGTGDHQFDIYRMMRDLNRNEWAGFFPKTNVFWIHYLAEKFFVKGRYTEDKSYIHQFFMKELRQLKDSIMEYASCTEFIFSPACDRYKELKVKPPNHDQVVLYFRFTCSSDTNDSDAEKLQNMFNTKVVN